MKGIISWLKGFGTASLFGCILIEMFAIYGMHQMKEREKRLKEYYRDELDKCKDQDSEKN